MDQRQNRESIIYPGGRRGKTDLCWWGCVKMTHCTTHTHTHKTNTLTYRICWHSFCLFLLPPPTHHLSQPPSVTHSSGWWWSHATTPEVVCVPPPLPTTPSALARLPGQVSVCYHWKPLTHKAKGWGDSHDIIHKIWAPFILLVFVSEAHGTFNPQMVKFYLMDKNKLIN